MSGRLRKDNKMKIKTEVKHLKVEPRLDRKLLKRAAEIAAANKYPSKVAYRAALIEALKVGDAIVIDGEAREIKPTAADGRVA